MEISYPGFGTIVVEGTGYDHDIIVEWGVVRRRRKGPSRRYRDRFGHTPLSADEEVPWSLPRLVIGTGHSGRLPIMSEVLAEAEAREVELLAMPTAEACEMLQGLEAAEINAILHVTC